MGTVQDLWRHIERFKHFVIQEMDPLRDKAWVDHRHQ